MVKPCRYALPSLEGEPPPLQRGHSLVVVRLGGSSTPLLLLWAPCIPWGVQCTFRAGLLDFLLLGVPPRCPAPPPASRLCVVIDQALACPGRGPTSCRYQALCSYRPGVSWQSDNCPPPGPENFTTPLARAGSGLGSPLPSSPSPPCDDRDYHRALRAGLPPPPLYVCSHQPLCHPPPYLSPCPSLCCRLFHRLLRCLTQCIGFPCRQEGTPPPPPLSRLLRQRPNPPARLPNSF